MDFWAYAHCAYERADAVLGGHGRCLWRSLRSQQLITSTAACRAQPRAFFRDRWTPITCQASISSGLCNRQPPIPLQKLPRCRIFFPAAVVLLLWGNTAGLHRMRTVGLVQPSAPLAAIFRSLTPLSMVASMMRLWATDRF